MQTLALNPLATMLSSHRDLNVELKRIATALEICSGGLVEHYDSAAGALSVGVRRFESLEHLHSQDEECSLHPRLLVGIPDREEWLTQLASEHQRAAAGWQALLPRLEGLHQELEAGKNPDCTDTHALARDFDRLAGTLRAHMALEDRELLPLAAAALDTAALHAISHEMQDRRSARA